MKYLNALQTIFLIYLIPELKERKTFDLVAVKRIIRDEIENADRINQEYDLALIEANLEKTRK